MKIYVEFVWQNVDPWSEKTPFCFVISYSFTHDLWSAYTHTTCLDPSNFESRLNNAVHKNISFLATIPCWLGKSSYSAYHFPSYQAMSMSGSVSHTQSTLFLWLTPGVPSLSPQLSKQCLLLVFVFCACGIPYVTICYVKYLILLYLMLNTLWYYTKFPT